MSPLPRSCSLLRMDSSSYTCCYGNDVFSYQLTNPKSIVLFFPGDIQDVEERMLLSPIAREFKAFSYEETLLILHAKYPNSNIYLVRPSMKSNDISMYGEYLCFDEKGNVQNYHHNGIAAQTLFKLMQNYLSYDLDALPIILIGFSRGGLVLNQILAEIGFSLFADSLLERISELHWLDCGNGILSQFYPDLSQPALSKLSFYKEKLHFYFHLTSYLYEEQRVSEGWASLQHLYDQLQSSGIVITECYYKDEFLKYGELAPLYQHFCLLYEFHI